MAGYSQQMSLFFLRCLCHYISWFIAKKVDYKFFWHSQTNSILTIIDIFQTNCIVLGKSLFLVMLNIILYTTLLLNFVILTCSITVISIFFTSRMEFSVDPDQVAFVSLAMPICDPWDAFFYPTLTLMMDANREISKMAKISLDKKTYVKYCLASQE